MSLKNWQRLICTIVGPDMLSTCREMKPKETPNGETIPVLGVHKAKFQIDKTFTEVDSFHR